MELKSTKGTSISYDMIRSNQIEGLIVAAQHVIVPCFIFNYREYNNATYFMRIGDFNNMKEHLNKKSFNVIDLQKYGAIKIDSNKKRTRYQYDVEKLVNETHL